MFLSLSELTSLFTGLFATSNPRRINGGATLQGILVGAIDAEVQLVPASAVRRRVIIQNSSDEVVAVGPAGVTAANGHVLAACAVAGDGSGGVITLHTQGAVNGIAAVAGEVRILVEAD